VLEALVRDPWRGTAPSPAALYRMLQKNPTLLLDEVEAFNGRNKSETTQILLAVLNAGHRKGATIPRCEPPTHHVVHFNVYGPKLFAAIGRLPDTLMDRSILIHIKRRTKAQKVERFRQVSAAAEAKPLHAGIARFAGTHQADIEQAYERTLEFDLDFLSDRDADLWTPLFAICSIMDANRLPELKRCAVTLSVAKANDDVDDSYSLGLLRDIRTVWPDGEDRIHTEILIHRLKAIDESAWAEGDRPLTPRKLAGMLRPFEIESRDVRIGDTVKKGSHYEHLKDAFDRYLDEKCATSATRQ
jgi:hypothetical protein